MGICIKKKQTHTRTIKKAVLFHRGLLVGGCLRTKVMSGAVFLYQQEGKQKYIWENILLARYTGRVQNCARRNFGTGIQQL